ncbi:uncharacterized protein LOC113575187 isoform X4 [Electrophorus electricus]|uniref:uncharacterized protein LOC113575187 isoform X4 n=1 Tax=Electrophorus electricus TaxID=8005 RepID=UPI0015D07625|nr:uncharacterized protein LOC113575187 isoform X4 [Electrophorus electricus]
MRSSPSSLLVVHVILDRINKPGLSTGGNFKRLSRSWKVNSRSISLPLLDDGPNSGDRWQMEDFKFEDASGVIFEGKGEMVKCGTCGERFFRIVSHLKSNSTCALKIDLEEFRKQLNRYNSRKRKRKSDDIAREKDIEAFRQELRRRKRKSDDKAREKDLAAFRQELRKRKRKSDDKARKMDLAAFREAARRRKKRSDVSLCRKDKISFIAKKQDPVSSDSDRSLE